MSSPDHRTPWSRDPIVIHRDTDDYEDRMVAAENRARWELGDPSWAHLIVGAFLYPVEDAHALRREKEES